jgi:hypothetical protein
MKKPDNIPMTILSFLWLVILATIARYDITHFNWHVTIAYSLVYWLLLFPMFFSAISITIFMIEIYVNYEREKKEVGNWLFPAVIGCGVLSATMSHLWVIFA